MIYLSPILLYFSNMSKQLKFYTRRYYTSMEVTQVLLNAQSIDGAVRFHAEYSLKLFQEQDLSSFLLSLSRELANEEKPVESRKLAGLILKNTLDAGFLRWHALETAQIKMFLLQILASPVADGVRSTTSQVIAKVAGIELSMEQRPELIGSLVSNIHQSPAHVKQATLETLGYLCEDISDNVMDIHFRASWVFTLETQMNKILTAVVQGMNATEGNNDVRLAAIRALHNALGCAWANFSNDMESGYITRVLIEATVSPEVMRVVIEATRSPEVKIRQAAFECLVSISSSYYEKLAPCIQDIFSITATAVREDQEPVALQAIEFWSSICDKEIDILYNNGRDFSGVDGISCSYFIKQAIPDLVDMLLETLLQQEDDQEEDGAWNIAMAGRTCLGLVAWTVRGDIVPHVVPFIEANITKPDWRQRRAATYALDSILEGPSPNKLTSIVNVALTFMLSALTEDPNNHVKDTTAWTLGRIFEFLRGSTMDTPIITPANCQQIITVLLQSMKDVPNVAEKACGALYFLAQGYKDFGPSSPIAPFFPGNCTGSTHCYSQTRCGGATIKDCCI